MSCCGQKRKALGLENSAALLEQTRVTDDKSVVRVESRSAPAAAKFRYTGAGSLVVDGLFARNTYRFSAAARELMIVGEDVAFMRGHPELIELKKSA